MKKRNEEFEIGKLGSAWTSLAPKTAPRSVCLLPEMIWNAARGGLPPRETRRVVDHLSGCPACAEAWQLARLLSRQAQAPAVGGLLRRPQPRWPVWAAAAAAAAFLLVGVGVLRDSGPGDSQPVFRQVQTAAIRSLLPDGSGLPQEKFVLRWTPPDGERDVQYRVTVTTESLQVVASAGQLKQPLYHVPADRLEGVPAGTALRWQVEAVLTDGSRVDSPTFLCRLQ